MANPQRPLPNEKPGALAGAAGHVENDLAITERRYAKKPRSAMSLYAKDSHKRVCRMLGYALTLDDAATWAQTTLILSHRLTSMELASVAFAALSALEPDARASVFEAAHWGTA